jgi:GNAT superfamily N-acetyltransferase
MMSPTTNQSQSQREYQDPYAQFIQDSMRFAHLRTDTVKHFSCGLQAHPLYTVVDPDFIDAIKSKVAVLLENTDLTAIALDSARRRAVKEYVQENILGRRSSDLTSVSDKAIALIARSFPSEPDAPFTWGRSYFEAIQKMPVIATVDETTGTLQYGYEGLNSYLYMRDGEPIAVGGLYIEFIPTVGNAIWGSRIAIAPEYRNTAIFGKMLAHLSATALRSVETSRLYEDSGAEPLAPFLAVFTTKAEWNQGVINLYKSLGMQDLGRDIEYNGLTEMVMAIPDILDPSVRSRIDRFVARFGA